MFCRIECSGQTPRDFWQLYASGVPLLKSSLTPFFNREPVTSFQILASGCHPVLVTLAELQHWFLRLPLPQ
jgi:hypothetical protein